MMTTRFRLCLLLLASFYAVLVQRPSMAGEPPRLNCVAGPLKQTFGGTLWDVYGCDDGHSVVVVPAAGTPATPFYFLFARGPKGFDLHGEGAGDKVITDAAFKDLKALSEQQIAMLYADAVRANQDPHVALSSYMTRVHGKIYSKWNIPAGASAGAKCTLWIVQSNEGVVENSAVRTCDEIPGLAESAIQAVLHASPLPLPSRPELFDRNIMLTFVVPSKPKAP